MSIDKLSGKLVKHKHKYGDISDPTSSGYLGVYATLVDLQTAYPTANNKDYAFVAGKIYKYTASVWVKAYDTLPDTYASQWYGVKRLIGQTSSALTRIGNTDLHKVNGGLPVQSLMRRCILKADGTVNYYLGATDSTKNSAGGTATLDGTDGHVMVEIPEHYARFWTETIGSDTYANAAISMYALPGFKKISKHYISAFEASMDRTNNKLASVINTTTQFRGGNNTSAWDANANSLLGRPVTSLTRAQERTYAGNIGAGWCEEPFEFMSSWRWLYIIEYANTNIQLAYNSALTAEGYRQGGLGNGVTDAVSSEWNTFNAYNPFVPCGQTKTLGNQSGTVSYVATNFAGTGVNRTFSVPSFRGIENPFGHIWKRIDGVNVNRTGGRVLTYFKKGVTGFVDDTATGYTYLADMPYSSGYILNLMFGEDGALLPLSTGGSSTTGWCDYYEAPDLDGWRGLLSSGNAYYGSSAGFVIAYAYYSAAFTSATFGLRLCYKA